MVEAMGCLMKYTETKWYHALEIVIVINMPLEIMGFNVS